MIQSEQTTTQTRPHPAAPAKTGGDLPSTHDAAWIPNEIIDALLPALSASEWQVACVYLVRLYSHPPRSTDLTIRDLQAATGIKSRSTVIKARQRAVGLGLCSVESATPTRGGAIGEALRWAVFERDDFTCQYCGSRRRLTADHIIPQSKGGPTTLENLQTLCRRCNSRKGARV